MLVSGAYFLSCDVIPELHRLLFLVIVMLKSVLIDFSISFCNEFPEVSRLICLDGGKVNSYATYETYDYVMLEKLHI